MTLQDRFNRLFSDKTIRDRGTLCQLQNECGNRNVTADVMNFFNYADNFIRFITEAHVVYLAMKLLGTDDPSDSASQAAVDASTKFLHDEFVTDDDCDTWSWHICGESRSLLSCSPYHYRLHTSLQRVISYSALRTSRLVPPSAPTPLLTPLIMLCISVCTDRSDVDTVRCCCNIESHFGTWFHVDCVNLDVLHAADELWWCSDECHQHQLRTFCELKNYNKNRHDEKLLWSE